MPNPIDTILQPGRLITGKGIFFGVWTPKDRDGNSLGKSFDMFAAPRDLGFDETGRGQKLGITYPEAVAHLGRIRNLLGHDGGVYANEAELLNAMKSGFYKGEWFIPTAELLTGVDADYQITSDTNNLHAWRNKAAFYDMDKGTFRSTFNTSADAPGNACWYISCTQSPDGYTLYTVNFSDDTGSRGRFSPDTKSLSCRLVRAELRPYP